MKSRRRRGRSGSNNPHRRPGPGKPTVHRFRATIATYPRVVDGTISLRDEIRLVRSAVMYADHINLISPGATMLGSLQALAEGDQDNLIELMLALDDSTIRSLVGQPLSQEARQFVRIAMEPGFSAALAEDGSTEALEGLRLLEEWQRTLIEQRDALQERSVGMLQAAGAHELAPVFEAGLVSVQHAPFDTGTGGSDDMASGYLERIAALLRDPRERLLLDEDMASLARSMIAEGKVRPHALSISRAGQASLGTGMLARLPAFPDTPLDELLDVRADLDGHLSRYRRATAELAVGLRTGPFDEAHEADLTDLYETQVMPAIEEVREAYAAHGFVREVARSMAVDVKAVLTGAVGGALTLSAASYADLSGIVQAGLGLTPAALSLAQMGGRGLVERGTRRREQKQNDLYYLFEVGRRIE